ncbi:hypothetical protein OTU49_005726 [Cherax quadricarinatus]|uniref:Uncharacterized protein n=1 Tax=Cherax quadricarinatus TaxID=27406 RepID=A0AAW0WVH0_CHEQU
METDTKQMMCKTLPYKMQKLVPSLIESARVNEENRLRQKSSWDRNLSLSECISKAERAATYISIAVLITEVWSPKMRKYAEKLMLNKAICENYLESKDIKFVCVLDSAEEEEDGWVIEDQDDIIIDLIWNKYNMKAYFDQVNVHRLWVQRSYDRLKGFMPSLCPEVIERHDLTKFAFSQAVGYTLKFVHSTAHDIWRIACDFHLHNEPHHPQTWSKIYTPEEKCKKLELWMKCAGEICDGFPYGVNLATHDFASEDFAEVFLLESFLDMVAVEWERKKGQQLDITTTDLVYIEDRFLCRYTVPQRKFIKEFMKRVKASDMSWQKANLTEKELRLLSLVCEEDRSALLSQMRSQKRDELSRMLQHAKGAASLPQGIGSSYESIDEEIMKQASDRAYFIMVAVVVMKYWNYNLRKYVEELILKRAIEEQFIEENHLQWIFVVENRASPPEEDSGAELSNISVAEVDLVKIIWEDFNVREHFSQMKDHRYWIMQSYHRLSKFMPELPEEILERHDLSKFAFSQAIGYTLKWVHSIHYPIWNKACNLHLHGEPHHPEMWSNVHFPEYKRSCLESWLCIQAGGFKYGIDVSALNLASENMAKVFLYESFLDMVGVEWERKKGGQLTLTNTELIDMKDRYLLRYSSSDRASLLRLMMMIREADVKSG